MAETYEKRARKKRKEKKRRDKAELKRVQKEEGTGDPASEEEIAARYVDAPEGDDDRSQR